MKKQESGLVFLDAGRKEPYTTDEVIAECAGVQRPTVTRLIRNRQNDLEEFGRLGFEIRTLQTKGGVQEVKIYHLNEQQATLLITYLRNTKAVTAFKKALVREFYAMREELQKRRELRIEGKPVRRSLTDMIRDNPEHHRWDYKLYTDLAYKAAFGKTAGQMKKERAGKGRAIDLLTAEELKEYQKQEAAVSALYGIGMDYQAMKAVLVGSGREV